MVKKSKGLRAEPSDFYKELSDEAKKGMARIEPDYSCEDGKLIAYSYPSTSTLSDEITIRSVAEMTKHVPADSDLVTIAHWMFDGGALWLEYIPEEDE